MTLAIPLIDLEAAEGGDRAQLDAIRAATEDFGAVQVVNHGVPEELAADLSARMARLLGLPRTEKAKLASPQQVFSGMLLARWTGGRDRKSVV